MLGVKDSGFLGGKPEELGIETVVAFQQGGGRHVIRVAQDGRVLSRGQDLFLGQPTHCAAPVAQVFPIGLDVGSARQVRGHPDNRNIRIRGKVLNTILHATTLSTWP